MKALSHVVLVFVWFALLSGCGGGGSSDYFEQPTAGLSARLDISDSSQIPSSQPTSIFVRLSDQEGHPLKGIAVVLQATLGQLSTPQVLTNSKGEASVTLTAPDDLSATNSGTLTIQAANGEAAVLNYAFLVQSNPEEANQAGLNVRLLNATDNQETFSSSGDFRVEMTLLDAQAQPVPQTLINLSATSGVLSQTVVLTDAQGQAAVEIEAPDSLLSGTAPGTFNAASETGFSARVNYEFVATQSNQGGQTAQSIQFLSATPNLISLKGTGGVGYGESSQVRFKVVDNAGNPVQGARVEFRLTTEVGGLTLAQTEAVSNLSGEVSTNVLAGTIPTPVRVTARITLDDNQTLFVQSDLLTVTTGIPDQNSMSLSLETFAPEAFKVDGVAVPITIRLADRNNNPVPDGTVVNFTTEGGRIGTTESDGSCVTEDSTCTVTWTSQNPRPADHRVQIIAYAIGHESFYDRNADGVFNDGDVFDDLTEVYRDDDESGHFDPAVTETFSVDFARDERYIDYNSDGVFNREDGLFNGVPCLDSARCAASASATLTHTRAEATLIMADSIARSSLLATSGGSCLDDLGKLKADGSCQSNIVLGTGASFAILWVLAEDTAAFCHDGTGNGTAENPFKRVDAVDPNHPSCTAAIRQSPATGSNIELKTDVGDLSDLPIEAVDNQLNAVEFFVVLAAKPDNAQDEVGTVELTVTSPSGKKSTAFITVTDPADPKPAAP
ncbi:MAG: Ig-like domain-containing protein [Thiotrichales bacterium]|nr:Ig-like domain-containing protein [Thiotrichales bacterium]